MRRGPSLLKEIWKPQPGWIAVAAALALVYVGIQAIATSSAARLAMVQTRWLVVGLVAMSLCILPQPRLIARLAYLLVLLCLALLVFLILPGVPKTLVEPINGARCWINLGFMSFQPSEVAKIAYILALAQYLRQRTNYRTFLGLLVPFVLTAVPVILLLKEPDLGTAILFPPVLMTMLVAAGAKLRHLAVILGAGALAVGTLVAAVYFTPPDKPVPMLRPHQRERIVAFISRVEGESRYLRDIRYQSDKAMALVGAGQWDGYGAAKAEKVVRLNRLPEDHNDMIFPVIVARWGFLGGAAVIVLYLVLVLALVLVALRSRDPFVRLATVGFAGLIFWQSTINIAMTIGLLPVTGITLPLVSYGGTSLLATMGMLGLAFNFGCRRTPNIGGPAFEFDRPDAIHDRVFAPPMTPVRRG